MNPVAVRPVTPADAETVLSWMALNSRNSLIDTDVLQYPSTNILAAQRMHEQEPVAFLPVQLVAMLESFAPRPGATDRDKAAALFELGKTVIFLALQRGLSEIYFITGDEPTADFAKRHNFEEVPGKILRLKLPKVLPTNASNPPKKD